MKNKIDNNSKDEGNVNDKIVVRSKKVLNGFKVLVQKTISKTKEFTEKNFGKVKCLRLISMCLVIIIFVLIAKVLFSGIGNKDINYPVIYNNSDGNLYLIDSKVKKEDKAIKLSSNDSVNNVTYANTTNRYVLFLKNEDLYLYDSKDKEKTRKVVSDVRNYYFTDSDKYILSLNDDGNLYSYNFKGDAVKIDSEVSYIQTFTDTKVLYVKDGTLYLKSLNSKKDDRIKITDEQDSYIKMSEDDKNILYINKDNELRIFNIKKEEDERIAKDVTNYYCDSQSCEKLYYIATDGEKNLYYYNGKEVEKIANNIYSLNAVDVDEKKVVYTKLESGHYTLYYQKESHDAVKVEDELDGIRTVRMFKGKEIYYVTANNELRYTKIKGNKIDNVKTIVEDVSGYLYAYEEGYAVVGDSSNNSFNGTLYLVKNGKVKKIDDDVNNNHIVVGKEGKKVYYMKDYKASGDLYVTSGNKGKKIENDVYDFEYISDNLIYMIKDYSSSKSRGDLYRYNGSKSIKLAEDVTRIAVSPVSFVLE